MDLGDKRNSLEAKLSLKNKNKQIQTKTQTYKWWRRDGPDLATDRTWVWEGLWLSMNLEAVFEHSLIQMPVTQIFRERKKWAVKLTKSFSKGEACNKAIYEKGKVFSQQREREVSVTYAEQVAMEL